MPLGCSGLVAIILAWLTRRSVSPAPGWIDSTGDNALDILEAQVVGSNRVFIFGEPYQGGDRLGMHNIHYNQGDPPCPQVYGKMVVPLSNALIAN
jgi:hypothetical protein